MSGDDSKDGRNVVLIVAAVVVGFFVLIGMVVVGAAVIGSFVLGVGEEVETSPTVDFAMEETDGGVLLVHDGGEPVAAETLDVRVDGESRGTWAELADQEGDVRAGDEVTIPDASADQEIAVVWTGGEEDDVLAVSDGA